MAACGDSDDDRALVARVRAGEDDAYEALLRRYGDRLHTMLLHLAAGDAELAAEFTQEAFVRAYQRLDRFAGDSSFYTWLYRLARNRAIDLLARKRPWAMDSATLAHAGERNLASSEQPGDALQRQELRQQVQDALAQLPAEQREIILLRDFEALDYAAIAARLELAEGTVKSRPTRARAALRPLLAPRLPGGA